MKKKLAIILFSMFFLVGLAGTFWGTQIAEAASNVWNSCPRGRINCIYPGKCNLYIDTNGDRICDRSQPAPAVAAVKPSATTTTKPTATTVAAPIPSPTSTSVVSGPISPPLAINTSTTSIPTGETTTEAANSSAPITLKHTYYFVPVFLVLALLYSLTWILSNKKIIKTMTHRKIWNMVLLISMVISALLGLFLILNLDFNLNITLPINILFWHVEAGIALGAIGAFHIFWHWRYFLKLLKPTGSVQI